MHRPYYFPFLIIPLPTQQCLRVRRNSERSRFGEKSLKNYKAIFRSWKFVRATLGTSDFTLFVIFRKLSSNSERERNLISSTNENGFFAELRASISGGFSFLALWESSLNYPSPATIITLERLSIFSLKTLWLTYWKCKEKGHSSKGSTKKGPIVRRERSERDQRKAFT